MSALSRPPRWTSRRFPGATPIELAPNIWIRLAGTAARVNAIVELAMATNSGLNALPSGWSIAEHIGHLGDLEPLELARLDDYDAGAPVMRSADMTNRATTEAGHDQHSLKDLALRFATRRAVLVRRTSTYTPEQWARATLHPRLQTPMRLIDFMLFVAEHDDHHLAEIAWLLEQSGRES